MLVLHTAELAVRLARPANQERTRNEIENNCDSGHVIGSQRRIGAGHEIPQG